MPFDMPEERNQYEDELEDEFSRLLMTSAVARNAHDRAMCSGFDSELQAKCVAVALWKIFEKRNNPCA